MDHGTWRSRDGAPPLDRPTCVSRNLLMRVITCASTRVQPVSHNQSTSAAPNRRSDAWKLSISNPLIDSSITVMRLMFRRIFRCSALMSCGYRLLVPPEKIIVHPCPPSQWVSVSEEAALAVAAALGHGAGEVALHNAFAAAGVAVKLPASAWLHSYANGVVSQKNLV